MSSVDWKWTPCIAHMFVVVWLFSILTWMILKTHSFLSHIIHWITYSIIFWQIWKDILGFEHWPTRSFAWILSLRLKRYIFITNWIEFHDQTLASDCISTLLNTRIDLNIWTHSDCLDYFLHPSKRNRSVLPVLFEVTLVRPQFIYDRGS